MNHAVSSIVDFVHRFHFHAFLFISISVSSSDFLAYCHSINLTFFSFLSSLIICLYCCDAVTYIFFTSTNHNQHDLSCLSLLSRILGSLSRCECRKVRQAYDRGKYSRTLEVALKSTLKGVLDLSNLFDLWCEWHRKTDNLIPNVANLHLFYFSQVTISWLV